MRKITTIAGIVALGLAVAACGKGGNASSANLSDADNMLVPADENAAITDETSANTVTNGEDLAAGNVGADNMAAGNAQ